MVGLDGTQDAVHRHRLCHAFERLRSQILQGKSALHQTRRRGTEGHRIGRGQSLNTGGQIGGVAHRKLFGAVAAAHFSDDGHPRMEADAHRHAHAVVRYEMGLMQGAQGVEQRQAGMHGAVRGVFVGLGPAKVDQQAVAEILGDIAIIGLERGRRRGLVGTHHGAVVFGIELLGEFGRGDQVAEHHRDLPAFGLEGAAARLRRAREPVLRRLGWGAVRGQ